MRARACRRDFAPCNGPGCPRARRRPHSASGSPNCWRGPPSPSALRSTLIPPLSARAAKRGALLTTLGVLLIGALALYGWRNLMRAPPAPAPNVAAAPASRDPGEFHRGAAV